MGGDMILMKEKKPILVQWLYNRVMIQNLNALLCFTGNPGSGKSYSAIRLAELVAEKNGVEFSDIHICFTPKEFIRLVNSGKLKKGSIIILDEAGVAINSRKWQSAINLMMNYIVQTFRHRNYVVIMCVPYFDFIDSAIRKMFHMLFEMIRIDFKKCVSWSRPKIIQINQRNGKSYFKWLRYKFSGLQPMALDMAGFRLPSKELLIKYEAKKREYTTNLNKGLEQDLNSGENNEPKELTVLQKKILKLRNDYGLNEEEIGRVIDITQPTVCSHLKACKNKGFIVNRSKRGKQNLNQADIETIKEELERVIKEL